ncbi:MAG TPA: aquaporin, partial [Holophaga sp.]|nr:aquaporin [Holophaga sp.]
ILLGDGVVASFVLGPRGAAGSYNWNTIAFGWAFAVAVSGLIVGADNNPAITLANAVRGTVPWSKIVPTFAGTFLGGFLGALAVYVVYRDGLLTAGLPNIWTSGAGALYEPGAKAAGSYSILTASFAEFFGTLVLMWSVLAVGDRKNAAMAKAGPFVIGGVILAIGLCLGGPSGYSLNPARDLAPRILGFLVGTKGLFDGWYWLVPPVLVPCLACVVSTFLYDAWLNSEK